MMNYEYYRLAGKIYRISSKWYSMCGPTKLDVYMSDRWIRSVASVLDIMELNGKEITKEEAFMELL